MVAPYIFNSLFSFIEISAIVPSPPPASSKIIANCYIYRLPYIILSIRILPQTFPLLNLHVCVCPVVSLMMKMDLTFWFFCLFPFHFGQFARRAAVYQYDLTNTRSGRYNEELKREALRSFSSSLEITDRIRVPCVFVMNVRSLDFKCELLTTFILF